MNQKCDNTSYKRFIKGLLVLLFTAATFILFFPPIQAQASASDQDCYYFFTGLSGINESRLDTGYLIETNNSNISGGVSNTDSLFHFFAYYDPEFGAPNIYDYLDYLNESNNSYHARLVGTVSLSGNSDSINSTPVYFNSEYDSYIKFCSASGDGHYQISVDGNHLFSSIENFRGFYTSPAMVLPAGNYRFIYSKYDEYGRFCYFLDFSTFTEILTAGDSSFIELMYRNIKDKANEIGLAAQGLNADGSVNATKTVYYSAPSVNAEIIKALMKADGVTLVVTYNYEGYEFTSTITPEKAREMYRDDIAWYGPAYIAKYCGATWTGKTVE